MIATNDKRSHWTASGPLDTKIAWDAEITEEVQDKKISWHSLKGSTISTQGSVLFRSAPGDRGTEVISEFTYHVPAGRIGAAFSKAIGMNPVAELREALRHFKQLMEAGEIPTAFISTGG